MPEIQGQPFSNGENCHGVAFVAADKSHELDKISIRGEYPEGPFGEVWEVNEGSHILATIISGSGRIAVRQVVEGVVSREVHELSPDTAVSVPAHTPYVWQSDDGRFMKVDATFTPPFHPELSHTLAEADIRLVETLKTITKKYLGVVDGVFMDELRYDPDGAFSLIYGRLVDDGHDADAIFKEYGIKQKGEQN